MTPPKHVTGKLRSAAKPSAGAMRAARMVWPGSAQGADRGEQGCVQELTRLALQFEHESGLADAIEALQMTLTANGSEYLAPSIVEQLKHALNRLTQ